MGSINHVKLGIMQGRLSPRYQERYQAFPVDTWRKEFEIAKSIGFDRLEFILDFQDSGSNPLLSQNGLAEIKKVADETGIELKSICADYFMEAPFHSDHQSSSEQTILQLIDKASSLGVEDIIIPCVDQSSLKTEREQNMLVDSLERILPRAELKSVNLNLETDLNPDRFKELLECFSSNRIKVNYDTGNSASVGYDADQEWEAYGDHISVLHIKDRILGGGSVELGTGNVDFSKIFSILRNANFNGTITMQAAREENYPEDLALLKKQVNFIKALIVEHGLRATRV